jgi:hypothetical protein
MASRGNDPDGALDASHALTVVHHFLICTLFDRRFVPGGDHFYGTGRPIREACMLDGSMDSISDERWPEFSRQQVKLLVAARWTREKAVTYYPEAASDK